MLASAGFVTSFIACIVFKASADNCWLSLNKKSPLYRLSSEITLVT